MKKLVLNLVILTVVIFSFTSCEKTNVNEEIAEFEIQYLVPDNNGTIEGDNEDVFLFGTDKDEDIGGGGSTLEPEDDEEL